MSLFPHKYISLISSIVIVALTLILRDVIGISVPGVALLCLYIALMVILPYDKLVLFLFFSFPLFCGIPGYIMLACFIILIIKRGRLSQSQILPLMIIAFLDILDEGLSFNTETWTGILSFLSFCGMFFYFFNDTDNRYDLSNCILFFALGTFFTFSVLYINMFRNYDISSIILGLARSSGTQVIDNDASKITGHLAMNANTIAYYAICSVSCLIVNFKEYKNRLALLALIVATLIFGLLSFSRTYILCLLLLATLYFVLSSRRHKAIFTTIIILIFCAIFLFSAEYFDIISDTFFKRADGADTATAGGRTLLFEEYNNAWGKSLWYILFGCGVVDHWDLLKCSNAMHSGLQQIWVCLGITGLLLYIQQTYVFLKRYAVQKKLIYTVPFVVTFIFDQSIQFLNPYPLMLPIMVSLLVCKTVSHKNTAS